MARISASAASFFKCFFMVSRPFAISVFDSDPQITLNHDIILHFYVSDVKMFYDFISNIFHC